MTYVKSQAKNYKITHSFLGYLGSSRNGGAASLLCIVTLRSRILLNTI